VGQRPRETRSISALTIRSTSPGKLSSSQDFSIGLNISLTRSSSVRALLLSTVCARLLKADSTADTVECKDFADDSLLDWLTAHRWNAPEVLEKVRKTMRALVVTLKRRGPYFLCSMPGLDKLVLLSEFEVLQDGKCERASEGFRTKKEAKMAATLRRAESAYPTPFLDHYDTDSGTAWCWKRGVYSSEEYSSQEQAMDAWRKQTLVFTKLAD